MRRGTANVLGNFNTVKGRMASFSMTALSHLELSDGCFGARSGRIGVSGSSPKCHLTRVGEGITALNVGVLYPHLQRSGIF